jgi:hypothetical protein
MSWHLTRSSLCSGVKEFGTKHAHNFLFPYFRIRRTTDLGMFKYSAIILDAIGRSLFTKSATAAIFTSIRVDFRRPPLSPSSTSSLRSRNREYYLQGFDRFRASFPQAFCTNTSVSVVHRQALKQNFVPTFCSLPYK